jgi:hypothetical protein
MDKVQSLWQGRNVHAWLVPLLILSLPSSESQQQKQCKQTNKMAGLRENKPLQQGTGETVAYQGFADTTKLRRQSSLHTTKDYGPVP